MPSQKNMVDDDQENIIFEEDLAVLEESDETPSVINTKDRPTNPPEPEVEYSAILADYPTPSNTYPPEPPNKIMQETLVSSTISSTTSTTNTTKIPAAIVALVRNSEQEGMISSIQSHMSHFNHRYLYPYIFLNDRPFTSKFITALRAACHPAPVEFHQIPKEHWEYPDWVEKKEAKWKMKEQEEDGVLYGGLESYHHMCRYMAGFFFRHPALRRFDYYWRVSPPHTIYYLLFPLLS
jgi:hypothetical protein